MKQDYYFLVQYSRMLCPGDGQGPGPGEHWAICLAPQRDAERGDGAAPLLLGRKFDVSAEELESTRPAPITLAYTDYLLRVAYEGTLRTCGSPTCWSRASGATPRLGGTSPAPATHRTANPYAEWIQMYSAEEFTSFVDWLRGFLDSLTEEAGGREISRLEEHFLTATRYEFLFWEMSYNRHRTSCRDPGVAFNPQASAS